MQSRDLLIVGVIWCVIIGAFISCTTTKTTTTETTETGTVTSVTSSYNLNTDQLAELIGVAGQVANLVAAVDASSTPDVADDDALDQVADAALGYVLSFLSPGTRTVLPRVAVDSATTQIAMMAFRETGAFPAPEEIAAYVVTGTEPTEAELITYGKTGQLVKRW